MINTLQKKGVLGQRFGVAVEDRIQLSRLDFLCPLSHIIAMNSRIDQIPQDGFAPMAAMEQFRGDQENAYTIASRTIAPVEAQLKEGEALTDLANIVYVGQFIADSEAAAVAALEIIYVIAMLIVNIIWRLALKKLKPEWY